MYSLIPSKEVREYLKTIHYELTAFQKATLIWNAQYKSQDERLHKLAEYILTLTIEDSDLKLQMRKRYAYEQECVDRFKNQTENCIFVVYDEDDSDCGFFSLYETAFQYCKENGYREIQKHLLIKDNELPLVRSNGRLNPYMFPDAIVETEKYGGQSLGYITFNEDYEILHIWSNEMPLKQEKEVESFNPERFEFAYTEIPFPKAVFSAGTIVKDLRTQKYGVIATTEKEWDEFTRRVKNGLYVDFSDYALTVFFICDNGRWTHDHINPIYLEVEKPDENEDAALYAALEAMNRHLSEEEDTSETEKAIVESSINYAKSRHKEFTTIDEILYW